MRLRKVTSKEWVEWQSRLTTDFYDDEGNAELYLSELADLASGRLSLRKYRKQFKRGQRDE